MIDKIIKTVGEVLKTEVKMNTSQKNCVKWDSLMHIHLVLALEDTFEVSFEPAEIAQMTDILAIEQIIKKKYKL